MEQKDAEVFQALKQKTESFYKSIGNVASPALRATVAFTSDGFHHLRYDGSRSERKKHVQTTKFRLLPKAVEILRSSTTVQEYRRSICPVGKPDQSGFRKTKLVEWFGFTAITSFSQRQRVKVIVRRIGGEEGHFHFWSVIPHWKLSEGDRIIGSKEIKDH